MSVIGVWLVNETDFSVLEMLALVTRPNSFRRWHLPSLLYRYTPYFGVAMLIPCCRRYISCGHVLTVRNDVIKVQCTCRFIPS